MYSKSKPKAPAKKAKKCPKCGKTPCKCK